MKLSLLELYDLVGDGMGISFHYEELPGVVVTIGFSKDESVDDEEENNDEYGNEDESETEPRSTKPRYH